MTLRHLLLHLAILFVLYAPVGAQTSAFPWKAGISATFLDYQGLMTKDLLQYKTFDPGIQFGAHAYLNPLMNLSIQSAFIPEAVYPMSSDNFVGTSLVDVNGLIQFKSNGTIFEEEAIFAPYLSLGFGINAANNIVRPYLPVALGFRVRISPTFSLQFESMYKQRLSANHYQHLAHSVGFVFALPTEKKPAPSKKPSAQRKPSSSAMANNTFTDRDKDGVPDKDDLCPDIKGLAMYLGCPERDKKSSTESVPVAVSIQPNPTAMHQSTTNLAIQDGRPKTIPIEDLGQGNLDALKARQATFRQEVDAADLQYLATAMNNVYFEYGSKEITQSSYAVLDTVAMILEKYPEYSLHVQGHTDNIGTPMANQILSVKRAFQVKYYLVYDKGIRLSRISSEGYNSTNPIANNDTEEGRSMNRRVEFKLLKDATAVDYPN